MTSEATFSPCRRYRYDLIRIWDGSLPLMNSICLNPSTADEVKNDATVTRQIERARRMGFGGFVMTNAYAWRSTDPKGLVQARNEGIDPIGPENDKYVLKWASTAHLVICGWGAHAWLLLQGEVLERKLRRAGIKLHVLKLSKNGVPWHPLYLSYDLQPQEWVETRKGR